MGYDKIILDLLSRVVTLEEKIAKLENIITNERSNDSELSANSKKYRFLSDYLLESNQVRIKLSYEEIEDILNFKLPDSALTHRTFWANTASHSIALSWLSINYMVTEVNLEKRYVVFEKKRDLKTARMGKSTVTTEENHLRDCKNYDMAVLYKKLRETLFGYFDDVSTGATSYYIHWDITGKRRRQFAIIYIQKEKIRIETLVPLKKYNIGENIPDTHGYTLNYRTDIFDDSDIEKVKGIILDSYSQIKHLI